MVGVSLIGKNVFLILKTEHNYKGLVMDIDDKFLTIRDKYNASVSINLTEIMVLKLADEPEESKDGEV